MSDCLIVSGGPLDVDFAANFLRGRRYGYVIAVDAGVRYCALLGIEPDAAVGDFDTFGLCEIEEFSAKTGLKTYIAKPEKDESDTELAFKLAEKSGFLSADVIGATGGRIDHELSNIELLWKARTNGFSTCLYDAKNRIRLLDASAERETCFRRDELYGRYISFIPLSERVRGITLKGFKYPLSDKDISIIDNPSLCLSNELISESGTLSFEEGALLCVESRD